ncbi:MAG: hypothetical protein Q8N28_00270 [bacterium]|nr:hypothetical protein [bacterium]
MEKYESGKIKDERLNTFGMAPKEWQDFFVAFKKIRSEVLGKIFSLDSQKKKVYLEKINEKQKEAFSSVDEPSKYLIYHQSIGGSTGPVYSPKLDFEGDYSLLKFYQEILRELDDNKK